MIYPFEPWRRQLLLWLTPLVFCVLNLMAFGVYRAYFAGRVPELQSTYEVAAKELEGLEQEKEEIEAFLDSASRAKEAIDELYEDRFSSEAERFTKAIFEIKNLARQAGLDPGSIGYPRTELTEYGLVKRNIEFGVEGTYDQLRTFINFLELTGQFLTLESVALGERGDPQQNPRLSIRLSLSTVFVADKDERNVQTVEG